MSTSKTLKIAIVVNNFPSISETFVALQIAELIKKGHQVDIYNLGHIGEQNWLPEGTKDLISKKANTFNYKDFSNTRSLIAAIFRLAKNKLINTLTVLTFKRFDTGRRYAIQEMAFLAPLGKYQIVHFQFATIADKYFCFKDLGLWSSTARYFCSIRGFDVTKHDFEKNINWGRLVKECSTVLPVCQFLQNKLLEKHPKTETFVVPSPVNFNQINNLEHLPIKEHASLRFISVGRLVEKKGFDISIRAAEKIKTLGIEFTYEIFGDGELKESLGKLIEELGLIGYVFLKGSLPSKNTLCEIKNSSLMLVPSMTAKDGDSEGIPNVIKEAMMLKTPVIATDHSGIPEIISHKQTGFIAKQGDVDNFYETIISAIDLIDIWPTISSKAYDHVVSSYSPASTTNRLEHAYRNALINQ